MKYTIEHHPLPPAPRAPSLLPFHYLTSKCIGQSGVVSLRHHALQQFPLPLSLAACLAAQQGKLQSIMLLRDAPVQVTSDNMQHE